MISREKYNEYLKELAAKERNNSNLKYLEKEYQRLSSVMIIGGVLLFILVFFVAFLMGQSGFFMIIFISIGLIAFGSVRAYNTSKSMNYYKNNYKEKVINCLLSGYDYTFNPFGQISSSIFDSSQFARFYDRYSGSDQLSINIPNDDGSKSNIDLTLCDLKVTKIEKDDEGNEREVNVYKGVFGYVDFPFDFKCTLCVNTRYSNGRKMEKIKLEDINFNKTFSVHSNDQIESRYILTPKMMEYLYDLNARLGGLKLILTNNKMYLGFNYFDMLELGEYENNNIETMFDNFYDEIEALLSLVEEIKNNDKVFKI